MKRQTSYEMVKVWYISDEEPDSVIEQRSDRLLTPPQYLTLEELKRKSGVEYDYVINCFDFNLINHFCQSDKCRQIFD